MEQHVYKTPYAVKINPLLRERVQQYCASRGLKQGAFVERALQEQLTREELLEGLADVKRLKSKEARAAPFTEEEYRKLDRLRKEPGGKTFPSMQAFLADLKRHLKQR